ncbi:MAG: gliding motility-associated C-terminal domain-containing protein [Saprospiraceae bacterium]
MRRIPLLISFLFIITALPLVSQNCGCADDENCPFSFTPNSTTTVCYDIEDAFNNDLANPNQGVCGVSLFFEDDQIGNLNITLISPNGTQVELTGTNGNCTNWTPLSTWDILFVPCAEDCHPDTINGCELPCVFNNCPVDCNWPNAFMTGIYQPFNGCLEDFNSGPVNGQWCLEIDNNAQFYQGTIFDFEIILCDQSGFSCCDADAGNLAFEPNVSACEGDSALQLTPNPLYGAIVPDPALYGYTYTVFSNGNLIAYDSLTDFRTYSLGTYQICGLSYLREDSMQLPTIGTSLSAVDIYNNLYGPAPGFCGDIDTNCIIVNIAAPPPLANLADTICLGEEFFIGTTAYSTTGFFIDTIQSVAGCDSIVHLDLTVLDPDTTAVVETICFAEEYIVGTDTFDVSGEFEILMQNQFGCDSLVMLDLTVLMPIETSLTETICLGDTIWVGTTPYTETGISSDTLLTVFSACDSVVNLDLTVVEVTLSMDSADTLTCETTTVTLTSNSTTTLGTLTYQWTTVDGFFTTGTSAPSVGVNEPGWYYLSVEAANCTVVDSVLVEQEADLPVAIALATEPDSLTCTVLSVQLNATTSTGGPNLTFQWTGNVSDPFSSTPTVTEPGIYEVLVIDEDNGCTDTDIIEIFQDIEIPTADAGETDTLSCQMPIIILDGSASEPMGNISYLWEIVSSGNIIPPANIPNPQVDEPGFYQLTVTNIVNGCTDTDLVGISNDNSSPLAIVEIMAPQVLNCVVDTVFLNGSNSQNTQNTTIEWLGNIVEGQGTFVAAVTEVGQYSLVITNTQTGCSDTTTVTVNSNYNTPNADAGIGPDAISCQNTSEDIGGIGSTLGANITYQWTSSPGGAFEPPTNGPFAVATAPGTYYLTVTNQISGCTDIDSVVVDDAIEPLDAVVAVSQGELTCEQLTFLLDGSSSVLPPSGAVINWFDSSGSSISNQLTVEIDYPDSFWLVIQFGGCIDSALVEVIEVSTVPFADAGADMWLDCNTGQVTLNGSNSESGTNIAYQWTSSQGTISSGGTTVFPVAEGVGEYILQVTNTLTACSSFDTVQVYLDTAICMPMADAGADGVVSCSPIFTNLQASGSVGPNFSYEWTMLPDSILPVTTFTPLVTDGTYVFCVTNNAVGLTACDTVVVVPDTVAPIANINPFLLALSCPELESCYPLDVTGTSQGPNIIYEWASLTGGFCTPSDVLNAEILGPGTYELFVTNTTNNCTAIDNVIVQLADTLVNANIALSNLQMPCGDTTAIIDAMVQPLGGNLTFSWTSPTGEIIAGQNTLTATVNPSTPQSVFYFTATNNINQCVDMDSINVFAPVNCEPTCAASASGDLDCNNSSVTLSALGSSTGADISYLWTALSGNLCGGETTMMACADQAGIYRLTVSRTYPNGAVFSTFCDVAVDDNSDLPAAEAGMNDDLNCVDENLELDGTGSAVGPNIVYQWTTVDGNILNGATTLTPEVDAVGIYEIMVTDTATGCFFSDFVEIGLDENYPDADAGPDQIITCAANTVLLDGSTTLTNAVFLWTTTNGDLCSNPNTEDVNACAAGNYYFTVTNPINGCSTTDSTTVSTDNNFPSVDVGDDLFYTCVDTVFTIQSVITAQGSGALDFSWATTDGCFISQPIFCNPLSIVGTYVLTVTDLVNNCVSVSSVTVLDATTPPVADAGATAEINCNNLAPQLDGSNSTPLGQLDFEWSTLDGHILFGEMTAMPTIDSAGEYQLIVTDQFNQCKDTASVVITRDADIPPVNAGADTSLTCTLTELNLNGSGSAVGVDIIYEWTGPGIVSNANSLQPLINATGTYILEVTDTSNGCVVTDTVVVSLNTVAPDANITASQTLLITCQITALSLDGSTSTPSGNVSYQWTTVDGVIVNDPTNPTATISSGGTYVLTVTDLTNGCTNQESISVAEDLDAPFVQVMPAPPLTCDSTSVQLEALAPTNQPIFTFMWDGPGQILNKDSATPTVFETGVYNVTITDLTNGCKGDSSVVVTKDTSPPTAVANAIGELDCDNLTATVSGDGSTVGQVTYQWTTMTNGNISTPNNLNSQVDAAGEYFLIVKKLSNGCADTASAIVIANALPIDDVLLSFQQPDCIDFEGFIFIDSVLGGTPPYSYSLNDSIFVTYPQFSFLDPGAYDLLVEGANGCSWQTTVSIFFPNDLLVELGDDIYISQGQSADLLAQLSLDTGVISNVIWTNLPDSVECPPCLAQVVFPNETTTYRIEVFDTTGCFGTDAVTVIVNEEHPFFVPTGFTPNGDNVNDLLIFYAGKDIENVPSFSIYDRWGNRVFHQENFQPNNPNFGWDGNFEGRPMNPAVFAWKAVVEFLDGKRQVFYGDLTLVR